MPGGTAFARPTGFVDPVSEAPPGNWATLRADALTPALSLWEREKGQTYFNEPFRNCCKRGLCGFASTSSG